MFMMPKEKCSKQCQKKRNVRLRDPSRNSNDMNSKHTLFRVEHQIPVTAGRAWLGDFRYGSRKYCLSNVDPQRLKDRQRIFRTLLCHSNCQLCQRNILKRPVVVFSHFIGIVMNKILLSKTNKLRSQSSNQLINRVFY